MSAKIQKILVPTDYSKGATVATRNAFKLARLVDAQVILLHAYNVPIATSEDLTFISSIKQTEEEKLENELRKWGMEFPGILMDSELEYGPAVDAIVSAVLRNKIDLIVMGTKGETDILDAVLGSVASNVINHAKCGTIVIPSDVNEIELSHIMLACDFHKINEYSFFYPLTHLLDVTDAYLSLVNVQCDLNLFSVPTKEEVKIDNKFYKYNHGHVYLESDDVEEALLVEADREDVDLIVLTTKHYNLWNRIWHKSLSKKMVLHATKPLLILHEDF